MQMFLPFSATIRFPTRPLTLSVPCCGSIGLRRQMKSAAPATGGGVNGWVCTRQGLPLPRTAGRKSCNGPTSCRATINRRENVKSAMVVGSGPNGLAAAIKMAQAGFSVDVYEAEAVPGGACRTLPLTLPGFLHDFGSAVHPLAAGSPFFNSLPLAQYGLDWVHGDAPFAHPLDDGTAVVLERDLRLAERELGSDGKAWRRLMQPFA